MPYDFENPQDVNQDNVYEVTLNLANGAETQTVDIQVIVEDVTGRTFTLTGDVSKGPVFGGFVFVRTPVAYDEFGPFSLERTRFEQISRRLAVAPIGADGRFSVTVPASQEFDLDFVSVLSFIDASSEIICDDPFGCVSGIGPRAAFGDRYTPFLLSGQTWVRAVVETPLENETSDIHVNALTSIAAGIQASAFENADPSVEEVTAAGQRVANMFTLNINAITNSPLIDITQTDLSNFSEDELRVGLLGAGFMRAFQNIDIGPRNDYLYYDALFDNDGEMIISEDSQSRFVISLEEIYDGAAAVRDAVRSKGNTEQSTDVNFLAALDAIDATLNEIQMKPRGQLTQNGYITPP